jgi:S1-C subfamily serine protease
MNKYFKAIFAFLASSLLICTASTPENGMLSIIDNSNSLTYSSNSDFPDHQMISKKLIQPVVKLSFEVYTISGGMVVGSATGFSVAYDKAEDKSYVVTNDHFCNLTKEVPLPSRFFYEDSSTSLSGYVSDNVKYLQIIESDPSKDLCIMLADGYIKPSKIAPSNYTIKQMEPVTIVGSPNGIFPIMLKSYISNRIERDILPPNMSEGEPLLLISEMILSGHSGSPVFNKNNKVIGVVFLNFNDNYGPIYGGAAIPLSDLRNFLDENSIKY